MKEEVNKKESKSKFPRKIKRVIGCCSVLIFITAVFIVIIGALTVTGYTKEWVCDVVVEDSYIWEKVKCSDSTDSLADKEEQSQDYQKLLDELNNSDYEDRVPAIVKVVEPSVVGIGASDGAGSSGILGTGFVINSDGLVATNHHVISDSSLDYFIQAQGVEENMEVTKIYEDSDNDIAILQVEGADKLTPLKLGNGDGLLVGEEVIAIGNPLGDLPGTVTKGIVSALDRTVEVGSSGFFNTDIESYEGVIQTDAAINPGNSGGPLINMNGEVVGINFATIDGAESLSFALPIDRIQSRLNELEEYGAFRIPYIGVKYQDRVVFLENRAIFAAQVISIVNDSPAEKAGLEKGDYIIGCGNEDFSEKGLHDFIAESEIGDEIELQIVRNGKRSTLSVTISTQK